MSVGAGSRFHCILPAQELLKQNVPTQTSGGKEGLHCTSMLSLLVHPGGSHRPATQMPGSLSGERGAAECPPRGSSLRQLPLSTDFIYMKNKLYKECGNSPGSAQDLCWRASPLKPAEQFLLKQRTSLSYGMGGSFPMTLQAFTY